MAAGVLDQSAIELTVLGSPNGVVDQSVVEIVVLPAVIPPPTPGITGLPINTGMGGGSDPCIAVQCAKNPERIAPFYRIPKTRPTDESLRQAIYFRHGRGH